MVVNWPEQLEPDGLPDPEVLYPDMYGPRAGRITGPAQVVFLKPLVQSPLTEVGDYTYFADPDDPQGFERRNVLFHFGPGRLIIGRYCAIARDVRFLMAGGTHAMGPSTFPFPMFGGAWLAQMHKLSHHQAETQQQRGDLVVGHDVWIGSSATVLAGVTIGSGAIVAAHSVVTSDVPPYATVAGNPARVVRSRFSPVDVDRMLDLAWWDWPPELVTACLPELMAGTPQELARAFADATGTAHVEAPRPVSNLHEETS